MTKQKSKSKAPQKATPKTSELKATTTYTFEELQNFTKITSKKYLRRVDAIVIIVNLAIAVLAAQAEHKNYAIIVSYLLVIPAMLVFSRLFLKFGLKRLWKNSPEAHNLQTTFTFRPNSFRQKNKLNDRTLEYKELDRIVETETNFYIMVDYNKGSIINKKDCSPELIKFIQERAAELDPKKSK